MTATTTAPKTAKKATPARKAPPAPQASTTEPPAPARRGKGQLDAEILTYLATRPTDDLGPYEIAKAIAARTGGVHPALERLTRLGLVAKTSEVKPVRYRLVKPKATPRKRAARAAR